MKADTETSQTFDDAAMGAEVGILRPVADDEKSETSTSAQSVAGEIRRVLLASKSELDPALTRFRSLYIYGIAISILMVGALFAVRRIQLVAYQGIVAMTSVAGFRRLLAVSLSYMTHSLVLLGQGVRLPSGMTESVVRAQMRAMATQILDIDQQLHNQRLKWNDLDLLAYYETRMVSMRHLLEGVEVIDQRTMLDASVLFAAKANSVAETPLAFIRANASQVHFLIQNIRSSEGNMEFSYLEALNRTSFIFSRQSDTTIFTLNMTGSVLAGAVVIMVSTLLIAILLPMVRRIEENKVAVFHELVGMPLPIFKQVGHVYRERLAMVHDVLSVKEHSDGDDMKDERDSMALDGKELSGNDRSKSEHEHKLSKKGSKTGGSLTKLFSFGRGHTVPGPKVEGQDSSSILVVVEEKSKEDKLATKRMKKYRKRGAFTAIDKELEGTSMKWSIMLKMSINLLIIMLYFALTLTVSFNMAGRVADAPHECNFANLRRMQSLISLYKLRSYAAQGTVYEAYNVSEFEVRESVDELVSIHEALLYGDANRELTGLVKSELETSRQANLMFHEGCEVRIILVI
jgi:hypothetical protein